MPGLELLLTAVAVGAAAGLTATSSRAVGDVYAALRAGIRQRLTRRADAQDQATGDPDRDQGPAPADAPFESLRTTGSQSPAILVDARGAKGTQVGSHHTQINTFH
ncbi:hypothetical protein [Micromonospora sediminicola]|uniref:hypothetical protein n=1 Tax=Micromonospora sediminicola TaxID=946078 RepID=UPI0033AAD17E